MSCAISVAIALTLTSCFDDQDVFEGEGEEDQMILGNRLTNPFTVENMKLAVASLKRSDPRAFDFLPDSISPTHYYVRFLPQTQQHLDLLFSDSSIALTDFPLDCEILQEGSFYHDPSLPQNEFTYLYSAVPADFKFPDGIGVERLANLFIPSSIHPILDKSGRSEIDKTVDAIEDEAFVIAGMETETSADIGNARQKSKWTPAGKVTVWDDRLNKFIPLKGVKIQARRWFEVKQAITDDNGFYTMSGSFRGEANYRLLFERSKFDIRSGTFGQAKINGPKKRGDWNVEISGRTLEFFYAHVFRAAMRYYYGEMAGLARPSFHLKYSVFDKKGNHAARNIGNWSAFGINPNILLYRYSSADGSPYSADEMFSNATHETAHTTHMQSMRAGAIQFLQVSETIRESWAVGVEWYVTQMEYKALGIQNYGDPDYQSRVNYPALHAFQYWNKKRSQTLTSLFIDLVDKNNQRGQIFGGNRIGTVDDPVAGYSFSQLESKVLKNVYGIESLKHELKENKPVEILDQQIDLLLKSF